jgi:hypothetical protein
VLASEDGGCLSIRRSLGRFDGAGQLTIAGGLKNAPVFMDAMAGAAIPCHESFGVAAQCIVYPVTT